jgi:hypothetical protein
MGAGTSVCGSGGYVEPVQSKGKCGRKEGRGEKEYGIMNIQQAIEKVKAAVEPGAWYGRG